MNGSPKRSTDKPQAPQANLFKIFYVFVFEFFIITQSSLNSAREFKESHDRLHGQTQCGMSVDKNYLKTQFGDKQ
jgi:hypothetical protein